MDELSSNFVQMDLYNHVAYHVIEPLKTMYLYVGVRKEFEKYIPKAPRHKHSVGIACLHENACFVFIDRCVNDVTKNIGDDFLDCCYCDHGLNKPILTHKNNPCCKLDLNHPYFYQAYISTIIAVSIHELVHLCGCLDEKKMDKHPILKVDNWDCPDFKDSEYMKKRNTMMNNC